MTPKPAIPYHARVRVRSTHPEKQEIHGLMGTVVGFTERPNEDGRFGYGVFINDLERVWCCDENELLWTGEIDEPATGP